ncbi:MAG: FAD-dependent oxidoreductase, partial [Rhodospirillales bacterium]|nr:FAD-dependent oxidoreductase [Rhodospirillales bacterium]
MADDDPLLTDMSQASGWYAVLPEPAPANRLKGDQVADWVVVGAGPTGLAAARRLGELAPEARIILLDSYRVGYGSAGRNAGFIIDTPHLTEELGPDANRLVSRLVVAGGAELERLVKKHDIDCEWSPIGHLTACVSEKRISHLHDTCRTLDASDEPYEWYDKDTLANIVGTDHYHAAVLTPRTVLMNPAAMFRGIGENLPENVELYEESPVQKIASGPPTKIQCAEGTITAKNVLLTNNVNIKELDYLKNSVFPLIACASLSRPLTEKEQAAMGGAPQWGITGCATVRRTPSNRILARHGTYYTSDFRLSRGQRRDLLKSHRKG